jgi:hypothetical protein
MPEKGYAVGRSEICASDLGAWRVGQCPTMGVGQRPAIVGGGGEEARSRRRSGTGPSASALDPQPEDLTQRTMRAPDDTQVVFVARVP